MSIEEALKESVEATKWAKDIGQKELRFAVANLWRLAKEYNDLGVKKLQNKAIGPLETLCLNEATEFFKLRDGLLHSIQEIAKYTHSRVPLKYSNFDNTDKK